MDTRQKASSTYDPNELKLRIREWAQELGFNDVGFSDIDLSQAESRLQAWLAKHYHGEMEYMARHGTKRSRPEDLVPETLSIIAVRMDYLPHDMNQAEAVLEDGNKAYVSRYALGRDYHKLMRNRLQTLCKKIETAIGGFGYRVFVDSAPVMEKAIAEKAGLGWIGKHSNIINKAHGSWFFLGEIYTDLSLIPDDGDSTDHCGTCTACLDICPTDAIVAPYEVDARRCISYLTIEFRGSIPERYRPLLGNRIYGCDDCQLVCPWNRFARLTDEADFQPRQQLDAAGLVELFAWSESQFLSHLEGSPIRRIGHECWLRNIAVALGNSGGGEAVIRALQSRLEHPSELVREHVQWALAQHGR
ncbi:MAG: tRNA epoxyqueuosine(34) reductase QueG [Gammaproteobacteria bacterium]|nr:tRNA epoxyqueuosine(34) reductase QueG [Gammaproteobacteria bacterium]